MNKKLVKVLITLVVTAIAVTLTLVLVKPKVCEICGDDITGVGYYLEFDIVGTSGEETLCKDCYNDEQEALKEIQDWGFETQIMADEIILPLRLILAIAEAFVGILLIIVFCLVKPRKAIQPAYGSYYGMTPQNCENPGTYTVPQNYGNLNPNVVPQNYGNPNPYTAQQNYGTPNPYVAPQGYGNSNPYSPQQNYGDPNPYAAPQNYPESVPNNVPGEFPR